MDIMKYRSVGLDQCTSSGSDHLIARGFHSSLLLQIAERCSVTCSKARSFKQYML